MIVSRKRNRNRLPNKFQLSREIAIASKQDSKQAMMKRQARSRACVRCQVFVHQVSQIQQVKRHRGNPNWGIARPYNEVRECIKPYHFKTVKQYSAWVRAEREQGRCEDFPINPQLTYARKNEWISRQHFLGKIDDSPSIIVHSEDVNIPNKMSFHSIRAIIKQIFGLKKAQV